MEKQIEKGAVETDMGPGLLTFDLRPCSVTLGVTWPLCALVSSCVIRK